MTPTRLGRPAFEAARRVLETSARPLELARFRHAFEGAPGELVFDALRRYQNADGGFGRALEPDLRAGESSALCTSIAFQILRATQAPPPAALVSAGIAYFLETLDRAERHWRIIPRAAERSPHAPWWNQAGREDEFDRFSLNPTAEILGFLYDYHDQVDRGLLALVTERVVEQLVSLAEIEMHDLLCCLRLFQTPALPGELRERMRGKLTGLVDAAVVSDPAQWAQYGLRPLQVADRPGSPFMAGREESVAANLDYEIASQNADGSWAPTWSWGDAYADDWVLARREWTGMITLDKLLLLLRFNRLE